MIEMTYRPLSNWPGARRDAGDRRSSVFRAGWSNTIRMLQFELDRLDAHHVVLEAGFREHEIRNDGLPRGDARRPVDPGVILSFDSRVGPLRYPSDRYTDWQCNVRAIALTLGSLRAVDRYGVNRFHEQYTGWRQLPSPDAVFSSREAAAAFLCKMGDNGHHPAVVLGCAETAKKAYRLAAKATHPDRGGKAADFKRVTAAFHLVNAASA